MSVSGKSGSEDRSAISAGAETYQDARNAAWAEYCDMIAGATLALQRGEISASQYMVARNSSHAALDDTLTAARKAAGYQS